MKFVFVTLQFLVVIVSTCFDFNTQAKIVISEKTERKISLTGKSQLAYSLYHNETQKYYNEYERGPCGKLMWIQRKDAVSNNGVCSCIKTPLGLRPITYWKPTNRCYFGYDQGPCEENKWLIFNSETRTVECQNNPCSHLNLKRDIGDNDLESLVALETDYHFIDGDSNTTCLENKIDLRSWNFERENVRVSRFLLHNESRKFYPVSERGPCPILMEIQKKNWDDDNDGVCRCKSTDTNERPILYWKGTNRCYFGYSQGPCEQGEWLVGGGEDDGGVCKKSNCTVSPLTNNEDGDECQVLKSDKQFFVESANGTCHETNTQTFCKSGQRLFLNFEAVSTNCLTVGPNGKPYSAFSLAVSSTSSCGPGFTMDESKNCVQAVTFD